MYTFVIVRKKVVEIHEMNVEYFDSMLLNDMDVQDSLVENAMLTKFIIQMTSRIFPSMSMTLMFVPLFYSLITSNLLLPYGFEITHSDTWLVYAINWAYQASCSFYVVVITVTTESTFVLFLLTACGQIDTLITLTNQLNSKINSEESEEEIALQVKRIVKLHQHHKLYIKKVKELFKFYFLIAIASLCSVMTMSMAAVVLVNWYLGVIMFWFSSCQILFGCVLGTHWQIKNEQLLVKIASFDWYKLSTKNKKMILMFLKASQTYTDLSAILFPLNIGSYVQIHKKVYSMFMLLVNVKE
ncbi:conserved hypothetical protein [Culex quinquefasciatus]|uniref:Odorant receptor n=1 Tax=Culex quinquefasciatus TaxID=7176 RepID=B0XKJ5_CULQU|nr:conserved hypothetical protein [Culex quinquefasciatus]|eukprot:XP_001870167.1 conserved hypothetical protein [Culex quinquefasciatus]